MKKFLTLTILVLMSVTAVAQYIDGVPQSLKRRGGNLYTDEGVKLNPETAMTFMDENTYSIYRKGYGHFRSAAGLSIAGAALLIPGTIFTVLAVNSYEMAGNIIYGMLAVPGLVLGTGLLVLSIPFYWSGISKLKTVVKTYNPQRLSFAPELSLGAQPSGIGMGIRL